VIVSEAFVNFMSDPAEIWESFNSYRGDLAFDVGANGGAVATMLARHFEAVVAFEPCVESYVHLERTAPANVIAAMVALSDHEGEVTLREAEAALHRFGELVTGDSLYMSWGDDIGGRKVSCSTLDKMAETYGVPDFIKVDTEGHELLVLQGGAQLFATATPKLMIEVHSADNGEAIGGLLSHYDLTRVDHPAYRPGGYAQRNHFYLVG
jgi:FkbM family methyltransferase